MQIDVTMRRILMIIAVAFLTLSCQNEMGHTGPEQKGTRIEFLIPGVYAGGTVTKSDVSDKPRNLNAPQTTLPDGMTLWLTYSVKLSDGTFTEPELKGYKIRSAEGYHSMFACDIATEEGKDGLTYTIIEESASGSPLILEDGTYKFKMIAPALPVTFREDGKGWRIPVDNGTYFYSTDGRYKETMPRETVVKFEDMTNGNYVQYVKLNPIVQQVARLNFRIICGKNVEKLEMLPAGIEVSGLQNPEEQPEFYWSSNDLTDTLKMKRGDKHQWITIPGSDFRKEEIRWDRNHNGMIDGDSEVFEAFIGDIGVLPTNAQSTTIVMLFNMLVNGIPTQYETTLNEILLEHAHSYDMTVEVSQKDGIIVFNWQNQSWTEDLVLN